MNELEQQQRQGEKTIEDLRREQGNKKKNIKLSDNQNIERQRRRRRRDPQTPTSK